MPRFVTVVVSKAEYVFVDEAENMSQAVAMAAVHVEEARRSWVTPRDLHFESVETRLEKAEGEYVQSA